MLIDDLIRLDFFDDEAVHDIKKGRSMEEAHRAQLLYYLWYLKRKGVEGLKGVINYPKQKRSVELELTPEAEKQVEDGCIRYRRWCNMRRPPWLRNR